MKVVLSKILVKFFFIELSLSAFFLSLNKDIKAENYNSFLSKVSDEMKKTDNSKTSIGRFDDGSDFDFAGTLYVNYENFAQDRYKHGDFIDAYYFKTKAAKIKNYKIISPANPYSFGIIPDDIEQFIVAREQLRNVSINSIINSNDGLVLADSYIAFDCWLEAFEAGNSFRRMNRCRDRFLDNMKAMRISLLLQGYNIFDMSSDEELFLNGRKVNCESCSLYEKGQYCNTIYFNAEATRMLSKMNVVVKRLEQKLSYFNSSTISIIYYKNSYGFDEKLLNKRLDVVNNLLYNVISRELPIKPVIKIIPITLKTESTKKRIYRDAITICISSNE